MLHHITRLFSSPQHVSSDLHRRSFEAIVPLLNSTATDVQQFSMTQAEETWLQICENLELIESLNKDIFGNRHFYYTDEQWGEMEDAVNHLGKTVEGFIGPNAHAAVARDLATRFAAACDAAG